MTPARFDHALFERCGPGGHTIPEIRFRLCAGQGARAVAIAFRRIFHDVILIRRDQLALFPYRGAHGAVGVSRIIGPVAARIRKIEPARKCAGDYAKAEFTGEHLGVSLDAFEVARTAMK